MITYTATLSMFKQEGHLIIMKLKKKSSIVRTLKKFKNYNSFMISSILI